MAHEGLQNLLDRFDQEDKDITGVVIFDIDAGEALASSTFSEDYVGKTVKIEQMIRDLEEDRILKLDPAGKKNWAMYSFGRKIVVTVRVRGSIFLTIEYVVQKAPSAAIEDALEIALMANDVIDTKT